MKELFNNPKEDEYINEFRQKIAQEMEADIEQRRHDLERSRNGFIGAIAGIVVAGIVSWFLLLPHFGFNQNKEIPIIRRPILPVKIQPSEPGGMEIQNQDKTVYALVEKNETVDTKVESLLPPPETPQMPTIVAQETEPLASDSEKSELSSESMDDLIEAVQTTATEKVKIPEKLPVIDVKVIKTNDPLSIKNEQKTAENTVIKQQKEAPKDNPITTPSDVANGKWTVQLMASSKKDAVQTGYTKLLKQYPVLENLPYYIETGSDNLIRLKVGAYGLKIEADSLCKKIKDSGGTCMVKER